MNKQEFIDRLRAALNGRVSPNLVTENVNYYEDYINTEMRKGRSEAEILQSLGDPRLIARTIIETNNKETRNGQESADYQNTSYHNAGYQNQGNYEQYQKVPAEKKLHLPGWLWAVIMILIVVVVLGAVLSILSFLAPAIIVFAVVIFLVKLFRDWLN